MDRRLLKKLKEKTHEEFLSLNGYAQAVRGGIIYYPLDYGNLSEPGLKAAEPVKMFRQMRFCNIADHRHEYISLHYTCSGTIHHFVDGELVQAAQGTFLLMKSQTMHRVSEAKEQDLGIGFFFKRDFINEIFTLYGLQNEAAVYFHEVLLGLHRECSFFCFDESANRQLENLMENLIMAFIEIKGLDYSIIRMTFALVFQHIIKDFQQQFVREGAERDSRSMLKVIRYIEQDYRTASLQELSKKMGMSVASLSRFIKKHSDMTFKELVLEKRFRMAEDYLIHTSLPINEIMITIGYENGSHFYQKFQKRYGMTPNEFREKNQKKMTTEKEDRIMILNRKMNRYWGDRAESYSFQNIEQLKNSSSKWKDVLSDLLPGDKNAKVLDIGTGPGFFAVLLAKEGYEVSAVDKNSQMLHFARKNAEEAGVNISCFLIEEEMPFQEESFDLIVSRDVVWMQLEPEKTLGSWYRLLKKGGKLVYFDAEWYGYLRDDNEKKQYKEFRRFVKAHSGFVYSKANEMEQMAYEFPLTYQERPQWDIKFWKQFHAKSVSCIQELNPRIYSEMEQLQYAKTPEFMVCVEK